MNWSVRSKYEQEINKEEKVKNGPGKEEKWKIGRT